MAVTLATQQNIALTRAKVSPKGWVYLRSMLNVDGKEIDSVNQKPSRVQLYIWQVPVMMLNFSNILLVLGILVLVLRNESAKVSNTHSKDGWVGANLECIDQVFGGRNGCICWDQLPRIDACFI